MQVNIGEITQVPDTPLDKIEGFIQQQRKYFETRETWDVEFRIESLKKLRKTIDQYQDQIVEAVQKDMSRAYFEAWGAEVGVVFDEIRFVIKKLKKWAKPRKIKTGLALFKSSAKMVPTPKGVTLLISAWNYPFHLMFMPLISAISAGNTAILKPSEFSVHSSLLLEQILEETFPPEYVKTVQGSVAVGQELLRHRFDHILFTGSKKVGQIYAEAAAKFLTPITLELGGKSPTIVHPSAKLDVVIERIAFGKWLNAAQTCVAPDYILVHESIRDQFVSKLIIKIEEFYGQDARESPDYSRIINQSHFDRLHQLLEENSDRIIYGGMSEASERYIDPTLINAPDLNSDIMTQEIFGPLLPIYTYSQDEDIIEIVRKNPNPLVLYIYAEDKKFTEKMTKSIISGDVSINDSTVHFSVSGLPVGGTGSSGYGVYRGKYGFETFSHHRSVFERATWVPLNIIKPPYNSLKERLLKFFLG